MILYAMSFEGDKLNGGKIFCEIEADLKHLTEKQKEALAKVRGSRSENKNRRITLSFDVRENMRACIGALTEARFQFRKTWGEGNFLWLLNYMDMRNPDYDYKKINAEKLAACTPEVRTIVLGGV